MDGDNNLSPWMLETLGRINWTNDIRVIVLYDGPGASDTKAVWGSEPWRTSVWGERNMGDPATLQEFVGWGRAMCPSRQVVLAIMNHGKATQGIAYDDRSAKDRLTAPEINQALWGMNIDVLFLDACLMAEVGELYELRDSAGIVVASANLGWSVFIEDEIPGVIRALPPTHTSADVGIGIAKAYAAACSGYPYTVAVFDQSQIHKALTPLKRLADYEAALRVARQAVQRYDSQSVFLKLDDEDDFVDVRDLLRLTALQVAITAGNNSQQLSDAQMIQNEIDAMSSYVLYKDCRSTTSMYEVDLDDAHGLAVYFPTVRKYAEFDQYVDGALFPDFTAACPEWMGIVEGAAWLESTRLALPESDVPPMLEP